MKFTFLSVQMVISYRISLFLLCGLLSLTVCFGQNKTARGLVSFGPSAGLTDDTLYLDVNQDIAVQLLPFEDVLKIAISHSPLIKYQNEIANSLNSSYAVTKTQILQNVAGGANYSTGNQAIVSSGGTTVNGRDAIGQIANGYRVGVDVRISLYDLFGRKHQVRQAYSNYRAAVIQKDVIELQLKRELVTVYQDMITMQQILKVRLIDEQASLAAYRIAEAEIQKGKTTAEGLASATSRYVETKSVTEQVKGEFLKNVHQFEALVGVPIQRLKRN